MAKLAITKLAMKDIRSAPDDNFLISEIVK